MIRLLAPRRCRESRVSIRVGGVVTMLLVVFGVAIAGTRLVAIEPPPAPMLQAHLEADGQIVLAKPDALEITAQLADGTPVTVYQPGVLTKKKWKLRVTDQRDGDVVFQIRAGEVTALQAAIQRMQELADVIEGNPSETSQTGVLKFPINVEKAMMIDVVRPMEKLR